MPFLSVVALGLFLYLLLRLLRSQRFWDWVLGGDLKFELFPNSHEQSGRPLIYPPSPLTFPETPAPAPPKVYRNFGSHHNPLALTAGACVENFEQLDARTWQCPTCKLLHFEKPGE
jgi:hypothetical protein